MNFFLHTCGLFLLIILTSGLQGQEPYHIKYSLEDGLPSDEVYDIEQDESGRIWISTDRGVASYDGYNFTSFDKSDGLAHNTIFEIFKDEDRRLWFSAYDGTLTYLENESFIIPKNINEQIKKTAPSQWVRTLKQISPNRYVISFSQTSLDDIKGYYILDLQSENVEEFDFNEKINSNLDIDFFWEYKALKLTKNDYPISESQFFDKENFLYLEDKNINRSSETATGLNPLVYDKIPSTITWVQNNQVHYSKKIPTQVESIVKHADKIFIGTWEGLKIIDFNKSKDIVTTLLEDKTVTGLKIDKEQNLWLSTQNAGVICIPNLLRINTYPIPDDHSPTNLTKINDNLFLGFKDGTLLRGLDTDLKTIFELKNYKAIFYPFLVPIKNKAYTSGFSYLDLTENYKLKSDQGVRSNYRNAIKLHDDKILFANSNLSIFGKNYWKNISWPKENIYSLYQCANRKILIGTIEGASIVRNYGTIDVADLKPEKLQFEARVNDIVPFNDSLIILASLGDGISIFNCNNEQIETALRVNDGLLSNQVNTCFVDPYSNIWLGTNFGLNKVPTLLENNKLQFGTIESFTTLEGLFSNFIIDMEFWNNELWVICKGGINHFDIEELSVPTAAPQILIDSVLVLNENLKYPSATLNHDQNDVSIFYTGITYRKPKNESVYRYRLSKNEQETEYKYTNNRSLQFGNLEPGEYSFDIAARNNNNIWSENPEVFTFTIKPHYSETLAFKVLATGLLLLFAFWLYKYRERQLLNKEKQKQDLKEAELRNKISELDALRNQMNPHFIYNSLNSIQNFIFQNDPVKANYLLSRFSRLMRSSLQLSKLENISLKDEIDYIKNYLELEKMRFEDKFDYKIYIDPDLPDDLKLPPLLVQPLIENAVKHGLPKSEKHGEIVISYLEDNEYLVISVKDNGKGYMNNVKVNEEKKGPNALDIIRDRIEIINNVTNSQAHFRIQAMKESEIVQGTNAEIRIPYIKQ